MRGDWQVSEQDLLVKGGRLIDPKNRRDGRFDVLLRNGRVGELDADIVAADAATIDATGCLVLPGLIDLHTHVWWGGTSLSVAPLPVARRSGTTTLVDAGSAGPGNFHGFRKLVIEPSPIRILPYLNISFAGIFAFSKTVMVGETADVRLLDARTCLEVAEANRDLVVGIKVRVGRNTSESLGAVPLDIALEVASEVDLPLMAHIDFPPPTYREMLGRLRPGDILTHCYRPFPNAPVVRGEPKEAIVEARDRGVIFDIGHGMGGFGFASARAMIERGIFPDVISSDVHCLSENGPAFDLLHTMSKLMALSMPLEEVIAASTSRPAAALRRPDLGTIEVGGIGDVTVLRVVDDEVEFVDVRGERVRGERRFDVEAMIVGGRQWPTAAD
jgi:dihydroorotase